MSYPPPPPAGDQNYGGGYAQPRTSQKAVWALVLGILSPLCCYVLTGIPAMILGFLSRKDIDASGGALRGRGMATAGLVLGIISVGTTILYAILAATGHAHFYFHTNTN